MRPARLRLLPGVDPLLPQTQIAASNLALTAWTSPDLSASDRTACRTRPTAPVRRRGWAPRRWDKAGRSRRGWGRSRPLHLPGELSHHRRLPATGKRGRRADLLTRAADCLTSSNICLRPSVL